MKEISATEETKHDPKRTFSAEELKAAFESVQAPDWKDPVNKIIPLKDLQLIRESIIHYTGTVPTFDHCGMNTIHVQAKGYRMGTCGDR